MIRNIVDFIDKDRLFYEDINNIEKLINDENFISRVENTIGKIEF